MIILKSFLTPFEVSVIFEALAESLLCLKNTITKFSLSKSVKRSVVIQNSTLIPVVNSLWLSDFFKFHQMYVVIIICYLQNRVIK